MKKIIKMSHSPRSMTKHNFTDGEFQPNRQKTDNLLTEYLCMIRNKDEISTDEYKEYVEQQLDQIREINATFQLTKAEGKSYFDVFLTVKIEHVATELEFYAIPFCDTEHRTQFQMHLNDTYADKEFCEPFHEIKVKHVCAAYFDKNWCRGEIVDMPTEMQPTVYLLDYGRTVRVNRTKLCMLKYAHALIRPFVIKCQLCALNGIVLDFSENRRRHFFKKFTKIAKESRNVCIYLNESTSRNADVYTNVLVLTDSQPKVDKRSAAYAIHEAYGVFYRPKLQFDDKMCEQWLLKIKIMENAINSNTTKRVPVFLSHVESPTEFYVQSEPVQLFMSKIRRIIDDYASAKLADYDFHGANWKIDDNCLVRVQNWKTTANLKLWYRGKIIGIDDGLAAAGPTMYKVLLRDYGRRTEVNRMDLMTVSPELAACGNAVQKCTLSISRRWNASAKDLFNETIAKYRSFAVSCTLRVKSNMYVDLWATSATSPKVREFGDWDNVGYTIICTAVRNAMQPFILESQHNYNVLKLISSDEGTGSKICLSSCDSSEVDCKVAVNLMADNAKQENNNNNKHDDDDDDSDALYMIQSDLLTHEPIATKWLKPVMLERNTFRGMVTHITDRGVIYVQEEANYDLAHDISATISNHMLKARNVRNRREWKTGDTCFAEYEANQYHRCVIKRIYREHGTCLVKYVDYGTKDIRKLEDLQLATMYADLPILVHRCFIPTVKSTSASGWSKEIFHEFNKKILHEFCTFRIEGDGRGLKHKKYLPCSIDPIYQPQHAYDWLRNEKLVDHTGLDVENNEILYVG